MVSDPYGSEVHEVIRSTYHISNLQNSTFHYLIRHYTFPILLLRYFMFFQISSLNSTTNFLFRCHIMIRFCILRHSSEQILICIKIVNDTSISWDVTERSSVDTIVSRRLFQVLTSYVRKTNRNFSSTILLTSNSPVTQNFHSADTVDSVGAEEETPTSTSPVLTSLKHWRPTMGPFVLLPCRCRSQEPFYPIDYLVLLGRDARDVLLMLVLLFIVGINKVRRCRRTDLFRVLNTLSFRRKRSYPIHRNFSPSKRHVNVEDNNVIRIVQRILSISDSDLWMEFFFFLFWASMHLTRMSLEISLMSRITSSLSVPSSNHSSQTSVLSIRCSDTDKSG